MKYGLDNLDEVFGLTDPNVKKTPAQEYDAIAENLLTVTEQINQLKKIKTALEDKIWTLTPEEVGEFSVEGETFSLLVKRSERWSWDTDTIASKLVTTPHPHFVRVKYSIDNKTFKKLTQPEQDDFIDALTIKPSSPKVSISKKV